ncbi:hypothetical protein DVT68_05240 [Dyella solisilvae]|uniref:Uncharacterized protein n=1 Tax=Dyella solisilvae TaxID=1920168 RepID=A0A370KC61_9GAMM|nr:hypothetical protein [Dyella solisilvae]RDJ00215.1 hypothetical protein DVT68_05240 [Dyella solisilvae]
MNKLSRISVLALLAGLGAGSMAMAQTATPPANADSQSMHALPDGQVSNVAPAQQHRPVPAPGDRNCLQSTGSLIPAKPGHCLTAPGRSYSRQDILNTGRIDTAQALRDLDPSISTGGH